MKRKRDVYEVLWCIRCKDYVKGFVPTCKSDYWRHVSKAVAQVEFDKGNAVRKNELRLKTRP